jgi:hypothetical protein
MSHVNVKLISAAAESREQRAESRDKKIELPEDAEVAAQKQKNPGPRRHENEKTGMQG